MCNYERIIFYSVVRTVFTPRFRLVPLVVFAFVFSTQKVGTRVSQPRESHNRSIGHCYFWFVFLVKIPWFWRVGTSFRRGWVRILWGVLLEDWWGHGSKDFEVISPEILQVPSKMWKIWWSSESVSSTVSQFFFPEVEDLDATPVLGWAAKDCFFLWLLVVMVINVYIIYNHQESAQQNQCVPPFSNWVLFLVFFPAPFLARFLEFGHVWTLNLDGEIWGIYGTVANKSPTGFIGEWGEHHPEGTMSPWKKSGIFVSWFFNLQISGFPPGVGDVPSWHWLSLGKPYNSLIVFRDW